MPRRRLLRKIVEPPRFKGFKPTGCQYKASGKIELLFEEYEALKLSDYNLLNHHEACKMMGVSRPTYARVYESARRKIAKALVEGKEIITVLGNAYLDKNWFMCTKCFARFTMSVTIKDHNCPGCSSSNIKTI
jgi:predicted DNA-binding protein (UPF0251 family)